MSTFSGLFEEIPFISADRFDGENLRSKIFFLSHCHMDHMRGLDRPEGLPGPLYTSAVSRVLVRKQFPNVQDVRVLEIGSAEEISYESDGEEYRVVVTALPARHCPGSIMLLIQYRELKILYTGDFRLTKADLDSKFASLRQLEPDVVYLDSGFLKKCYPEFPTQTESIKKICDLITEWTSISPQHKVIIRIPAQYGSEFLFMEIGRKLKQKIYVANEQLEKYIFFPDMDQCISSNLKECNIFSLQKHEKGMFGSFHYRIIQPSALFWKNWTRGQPICKEENKNTIRVAYSSHSSYTELKDFIEFVKPKKVQLNVVSKMPEEMYKCLDEILGELEQSSKERKEPAIVKSRFDNLFRVPNSGYNRKYEEPIRMPIKRVKL